MNTQPSETRTLDGARARAPFPDEDLPEPLPSLPGKQLSDVLREMRDEEAW